MGSSAVGIMFYQQLTGDHDGFRVATQTILEQPGQYTVSVRYEQAQPLPRTLAAVEQLGAREEALRGPAATTSTEVLLTHQHARLARCKGRKPNVNIAQSEFSRLSLIDVLKQRDVVRARHGVIHVTLNSC